MKPGQTWKCECGTLHRLDMYVAAHWTERLIHTCETCSRQHSVERGMIELVKDINVSRQRKKKGARQ